MTAYEILGLVFAAVLVRATIIEDNRHQLQQSLPTMSLFTWDVAKHAGQVSENLFHIDIGTNEGLRPTLYRSRLWVKKRGCNLSSGKPDFCYSPFHLCQMQQFHCCAVKVFVSLSSMNVPPVTKYPFFSKFVTSQEDISSKARTNGHS